MDIGRDVLTKSLIGNTCAEKVFTPWWITLQHYLVYFLVVLGLIAVPINPTLSVQGNCSYKLSSPYNYLLPHRICRLENDTIVVLHKYAEHLVNDLNMTEINSNLKYKYFKSRKYIASLQDIQTRYDKADQNYDGCYIRSNPRLFGFHVYWKCVNENLSPITLYFPYLVLTIALVLVLLERILTRYLWTGKRIEKFYDLLIKDVLETGDIEKVDTKENRQKCRQINYEFKNSWFYSKAYISQTVIKLVICITIISWSLFHQCNRLRDSFRTTLQCRVFDYTHECSIPSSGMNLVIFDLVNIVLFFILIVAGFNIIWHLRLKTVVQLDHDHDDDHDSSNDSNCGFLKNILKTLRRMNRNWRPTKLTRLIETHLQGIAAKNEIRNLDHLTEEERVLYEIYILSPDMQMLLNLLAAQEGIWSSILVLSIFDKSFKDQFRVRDSQITSIPNVSSSRRRDITIAWNEPIAAQFLGHNVPKEHLMYVMEIDPPIDKLDDGVTMMPACSVNGANCVFEPIQPISRKVSVSSSNSSEAASSKQLSRQESVASMSSTLNFVNPDKSMTIIDGGVDDADQFIEIKKKSKSSPQTNLVRKVALLYGRKKSADKVRNFKSTLAGLRVDKEYIIKISFVLSGKKLGSESYRILGNDGGQCRKITSSSSSSNSALLTPKSSIQSSNSRSSSITSMMQAPEPMTNPDPIRKLNGQRLDSLPESLNENILVAKSSEEVKVLLKQNQDSNESTSSSSSLMVILNFVASWCSICSKVEPQMEDIAETYGNKSTVNQNGIRKEIRFIKADIDDCGEAAEAFEINALPSAIIIIDQKIISTHFGLTVAKIREDIELWLSLGLHSIAEEDISSTTLPDLTSLNEKQR